MKNLIITCFVVSFITISQTFAQVANTTNPQINMSAYQTLVLTNETHGLRGGDIHITQTADYVDEGKGGENIVWDFSQLVCIGQKVSHLVDKDSFSFEDANPLANVAIVDGENKSFLFDVNSEHIEYLGLKTPRSLIIYDKPLVKMKYPFTYGNSFEDDFEGEGFYNNGQSTVVTGEVRAEADGYGTLILPNEIFSNVLRVVTITTTQERTMCGYTETETTKYLWYTEGVRYPVLVLMKTVSTPYNGDVEVSKKAYYTEKVLISKNKSSDLTDINELLNREHLVKLYPNPFSEQMNIEYQLTYNCDTQIDLYDMSGRKISTLLNRKDMETGTYQLHLSQKEHKLKAGTYFLRFTFGKKIYVEKIICEE